MKPYLLLALCLLNLYGVAQNCVFAEGRWVNCTDSLGRKQGHWFLYEKYLVFASSTSHGGGEDFKQYDSILTAEGSYIDNQPDGIWSYYTTDRRYQRDQAIAKSITYNGGKIVSISNHEEHIRWSYLLNGNILAEDLSSLYYIEYSPDTAQAKGWAVVDSDTINILCSNRQCNLSLRNKPYSHLLSFSSSTLFTRLFMLQRNEYDRLIRLSKPEGVKK